MSNVQYKFMEFIEDDLETIIFDIKTNYTYNETVRLFRDNSNTVDVLVDGEITEDWLSLDIDEQTGNIFVK